eukprot:362504-Chlamydomonas_euryale.AAC.20
MRFIPHRPPALSRAFAGASRLRMHHILASRVSRNLWLGLGRALRPARGRSHTRAQPACSSFSSSSSSSSNGSSKSGIGRGVGSRSSSRSIRRRGSPAARVQPMQPAAAAAPPGGGCSGGGDPRIDVCMPNSMEAYAAAADERVYAPAAGRNQAHICAVVRSRLEASGMAAARPCPTLLEVASGTGEHAAALGGAMPWLTLQPTDLTDELFASIRAHAGAGGLTN